MPSPPWVDVPQSRPFPSRFQYNLSSQLDSEHSTSFRLLPFEVAAFLPSVLPDCAGSPPVVRDALLHILYSLGWEKQEDILADLLLPIVEATRDQEAGLTATGIVCEVRSHRGASMMLPEFHSTERSERPKNISWCPFRPSIPLSMHVFSTDPLAPQTRYLRIFMMLVPGISCISSLYVHM